MKKQTGKALLFALLFLLLLSVMTMFVVAETDTTSGKCGENVYWFYDESTRTLTISGTGEMEDFNPWGSPMPARCEKVVIEDGVTSIADWAFTDNYWLVNITIPKSVVRIGDSAFYGCESLTKIMIPDGVTSMGDYTFLDCYHLEGITVSVNNPMYSSDENGCLYNKNKTELIQFPIGSNKSSFSILNSVTRINAGAFRDCSSLTRVTIPNSVTSIEDYAFSGCSSLTSVTILDSVTSIENYAFSDCSSLTSVTIPNGVYRIGDYAFSGCSELTTIIIPDSVIEFGYEIFDGCDALQKSKVSLDANGGQLLRINDIDIDAVYVVPNTPMGNLDNIYSIRPGYCFDGWYTALTGGTKVTENTKVRKDLILYAHWIPYMNVNFTNTSCTVEEVLTNEDETIVLIKTDIGWFFTDNGTDYTPLDFSRYLPTGSNWITAEIYVTGNTFIVCLSIYETIYSESATSYILLTSTDLLRFVRQTMPENDVIGNVLKLKNGTYIVQPGTYTKYLWEDGVNKQYYYTTTDFQKYQKHQVPSTEYDIVTYSAADDYLLLEFRHFDYDGFGDGTPTQIAAIYSTKDFNSYKNITPAKQEVTNSRIRQISYEAKPMYGDYLLAVSTHINQDNDGRNQTCTYRLSKIDLATGNETVFTSNTFALDDDYSNTWQYVYFKNKFVYFYDNKTYIYDFPTGSFGEGICNYREMAWCDNITKIDDSHAAAVNGSNNTLFIFNPNRLDQIKSIDISQYGYVHESNFPYNIYYIFTFSDSCYLLATYGDEHKVSKMDLDLTWDGESPHNHSYTSTITKQPGCMETGIRTYTCVDGDDSYTEIIPALGHTAPDENGNCTRCGTHIQDIETTESFNFIQRIIQAIRNFFARLLSWLIPANTPESA